MPKSIGNLPKLKNLALSSNKINVLPVQELLALPLIRFTIDDNPITSKKDPDLNSSLNFDKIKEFLSSL